MLRGLSNKGFGDNASDSLLENAEDSRRTIANRDTLNPDGSRLLQTISSIPMYFHVIGNDLSDSFLNGNNGLLKQIERAFAGNFTFEFQGLIINKKDEWKGSQLNTAKDLEMKRITHVGGKDTLNVWFKLSGARAGGDGTFPWENAFTSDGVTVWGLQDKNLVIHEIGHWLGLYHIFRGGSDGSIGCDGEDDLVADTPRRSAVSWGRNGNTRCGNASDDDTCPNSITETPNGKKPWYNYMDYSNCNTQSFTPGQMERAKEQYEEYRKDFCYKEEIGACRSINALMISRPRTRSRSKCKRMCDGEHACRGYEFRTDGGWYRCELHYSTIDYVDDNVPKHKCYRKDFNFC